MADSLDDFFGTRRTDLDNLVESRTHKSVPNKNKPFKPFPRLKRNILFCFLGFETPTKKLNATKHKILCLERHVVANNSPKIRMREPNSQTRNEGRIVNQKFNLIVDNPVDIRYSNEPRNNEDVSEQEIETKAPLSPYATIIVRERLEK